MTVVATSENVGFFMSMWPKYFTSRDLNEIEWMSEWHMV